MSSTKTSGTEPLNKATGKVQVSNGNNGQSVVQSPTSPDGEVLVAQPKYKGVVKGIFLVINLGLMVMMAATGALGIQGTSSVSDVSTVLVGLYMILFAGLLAVFELIQIYPCSMIDFVYKKNFGFLYGLMGKSGFTVFMAVLSFGLSATQQLPVATGEKPES